MGVRVVITCKECGVEFKGKPKERFCPRCKHEHAKASRKRYRAYLKANGWCYDCGMPVAEDRTRCRKCLDKIASYKKRPTCGNTSAKKGITM